MAKFFSIFWVALGLLFSQPLSAKVNVSPLFVQLSDAMEAVKQGESAKSRPILATLQQDFLAIENHNSEKGQIVSAELGRALQNPDLANLENLSKALYAFEKEQNPVDYAQKRQQFAKRVIPVYQQLKTAVMAKNLDEVQDLYKRFNSVWTMNEKVVRETSLGHYGQIETAMTFLRIAMLADPPNYAEMEKQAVALGESLADFKAGKVLQPQTSTASNAPQNLREGIKLLEKAYQALQNGDQHQANADISLFIQQWAIFEGEVSTRSGALYAKVETDLPVIMAKGSEPANLQQFQNLINELNGLDLGGSYGVLDAMLILLREGVEALLIIMALLTALNVANQPRAKGWIYAGAGLGVGASLLAAVALQQFFPAVSAGTNREMIEGGVGVLAVAMMLVVGAWLHSKASISGWQKFVKKQVAQALATGSLLSMLSLSFLSVFREGAETILFYVGMLPLISLNDLLVGIGLALLLLGVLAWALAKFSTKLPIHHLFKVMTALIYLLGFKILGVSVHSLQLTNVLPNSVIDSLPNIPDLGIFATVETLVAQVVYLVLIPLVARVFK
ncbi:iron permease [Haemophilus paracuniculus]|uniref:Iron permease n=1 Tax=Haemophilus paracuniculus TaxID=734 RepID=A0A1T0AUI8_9PAST|nr:FTR1 family protein [Haemophilus paracuniculus]OOS00256.1 iron permease [Haemophilus paracuniculus]